MKVRDELTCDACGHTAAEHFTPEEGYAGCHTADCKCGWFTCDFALWDNSK